MTSDEYVERPTRKELLYSTVGEAVNKFALEHGKITENDILDIFAQWEWILSPEKAFYVSERIRYLAIKKSGFNRLGVI
jgi:hypothetical protein